MKKISAINDDEDDDEFTSHSLSSVTLSSSATGRTIEIDAIDLVMKVGE